MKTLLSKNSTIIVVLIFNQFEPALYIFYYSLTVNNSPKLIVTVYFPEYFVILIDHCQNSQEK